MAQVTVATTWHQPVRLPACRRRRAPRGNRQVIAARQVETPRPRNHSEQLVARILDQLHIKWEYEPKLFQTGILDREMHAFKPDFWLPEHDVYLEVTGTHFDAVKRQLIRLVEQRHGVRIILVGRHELELLRQGSIKLDQLILASA